MKTSFILPALAALSLASAVVPAPAQVPAVLHYQGRIISNGTNFHGTGQFKFALVTANGFLWGNSPGNPPISPVSLGVSNGLYSVLLGDTSIGNMSALPPSVFANSDVRLRVWFNNGVNGTQLLTPDQRIAAVGYALMAANVTDGAITAGKLAAGAVSVSNLANGSITAEKLAPGAMSAALGSNLKIGGTDGTCGRVDVYSTDIGTPGVTIDGCRSEVSAFIQANGLEGAELAAKSYGGYLRLWDEFGVITMEAGSASSGGGHITLHNTTNGIRTLLLDGRDGNNGGAIYVANTNGLDRVVVKGQGDYNGGRVDVMDGSGTLAVQILGAETNNAGGQILVFNTSGTNTVQIDGDDGEHGGIITLQNQLGVQTIRLDANANGCGRIVTPVLEVTGGCDLSENFDIKPSDAGLLPGSLVCIDPENPGHLMTSSKAYDTTVAGIISGANGVGIGAILGQQGSPLNGKHPVALTGRVYCLVDADHGAIRPGDLITTSDTPGHGMRISDPARAHGAIIGKAMTGLAQGRGMVLVLVSLQ